MSLVSIVIPFRQGKEGSDCVKQLKRAVACFSCQPGFEVVVYDVSEHPLDETSLKPLAQSSFRYIHKPEPDSTPWGRVKNLAVGQSTGRYVLLFDVNLLISLHFAEALPEQVKVLESKGGNAFCLYPVLELSESYPLEDNSQISDTSDDAALFSEVLSHFMQGHTNHVQNIVLAAGCLLIRRHWFTALGGFRETFPGYGFEQLDLVHRLAAYYPVGKKPDDYAIDVATQFPADFLGFRRYFSFYGLPHLFENRFLIRQSDRQDSKALKAEQLEQDRAQFAEILAKGPAGCRSLNLASIKASSELGRYMLQRPFDSKEELPSLADYIQELMAKHGYDQKRHPGLFHSTVSIRDSDNATGGVLSRFQTLFKRPSSLLRKIGLFQ